MHALDWRLHGISVAALCGLLLFVSAALAQEPFTPDAPVAVEKVALFKNGLGYFNASAVLPDGATSVRLGQLPVPAYGTFWVGYPEDVKLQSLITGMEEYDEHQTAQSIADMLRANAGKHVTLRLANEGAELIQGVLLVPDRDANPFPENNPYFMGGRPPTPQNAPYVPNPGSGSLILVQTDKATFAVNPNSVISASFDGADAATDVPIHRKRPAIRAELAEPAAGQKVSVSYLARGITWSPAYLIDLSEPETAHLSARALVINEVADLDNVELELITGFPNIRFSDVVSPVAQSQRLADFLQALVNGASTSDGGRNVMVQQAIVSNGAFFFDSSNAVPLPSYSTAAQGTVSEDLFLYPVNRLTLKQGETAWIPLFTVDVPYEHIYTWRIDDFLDAEGRYRNQPESPRTVRWRKRSGIRAALRIPWTCRSPPPPPNSSPRAPLPARISVTTPRPAPKRPSISIAP